MFSQHGGHGGCAGGSCTKGLAAEQGLQFFEQHAPRVTIHYHVVNGDGALAHLAVRVA